MIARSKWKSNEILNVYTENAFIQLHGKSGVKFLEQNSRFNKMQDYKGAERFY